MKSWQSFLSRRYAQAFLASVKQTLSDEHIRSIQQAINYFACHPTVITLLKVPLIKSSIKEQALHTVLIEKMTLPQDFMRLVALLIEDKRAFLISKVLHALLMLYQERASVMFCTVTSSAPLAANEHALFEDFFNKKIGQHILYTYTVDSHLIAGIRMQSSTVLWEYSIAQQLTQAQRSLMKKIG